MPDTCGDCAFTLVKVVCPTGDAPKFIKSELAAGCSTELFKKPKTDAIFEFYSSFGGVSGAPQMCFSGSATSAAFGG
jgi:hypothetical protein